MPNIVARLKDYELKRKNREFLKNQKNEALKDIDKCFVVNGRHKARTEFGKQIFDTLAKLRREKLGQIKPKNLDFQNGLIYRFDISKEFSKPPIVIKGKPKHTTYSRNVNLRLRPDFKSKISEAFSSGTKEKIEYLRLKTAANTLADNSSSDDDEYLNHIV